MRQPANCYLCGATVDPRRGRDHVPPKGFFPDPKPENLITVPCCTACNSSFAKDDDAIRAMFACAIEASPAGKRIWNEKVIPGTIKRSPAFREDMLSMVKDIELLVEGKKQTFPALLTPDERITPFIIRIAKGLLTHFYPEVDYLKHNFEVHAIVPDSPTLEKLSTLLQSAKVDQRGNGVFKVFHAVTDTGMGGFCLQVYYEAISYLVLHRNPDAQQSHGKNGH